MKLYDLKYLEEIAGGDNAFKEEMLKYYIENTPAVLQTLDKSLNDADWGSFRFAIHKFTPNLTIVGMTALAGLANRLEVLATSPDKTGEIPSVYSGFREGLVNALSELTGDFGYLTK